VKKSQRSIFLILLLVSTLAAPSALAATKPKAAGRSSTSVVNTILNGKGAPSNTLGIDGDFYIDTRSLLISGPKTKGKWPAARSLQGANGINGVDGKNGADAKNVSTASTVAGPVGPQGPQGERGEKGADGAAGASGSAGPTGAPGPAGATGPAGSGATGAQGPSGSNGATGATGATGAQGAQGAQGPAGSTGATGATGETGTAGATGARGETGTAGPSEVTNISIPTWTLQTATEFGFSTSTAFGLLKAGKSYQIAIQVWGTTNSFDSPYGLELLSSAGNAPSHFYTVAPYRYAMTASTSYKYGFSVIGTITVGGSDVSLAIKVIDAAGDSTAKPMVLTGKALITLVGEVK
jgi:hypothetical protein